VAEFDAGNRLEPEKSGGCKPAVSRNQTVLAVQQDGIGETEFLDAGCDLRDLLLRVSPGVPGEWNEAFDGPENDLEAIRDRSYLLRDS
jgi:hypothetical protein